MANALEEALLQRDLMMKKREELSSMATSRDVHGLGRIIASIGQRKADKRLADLNTNVSGLREQRKQELVQALSPEYQQSAQNLDLETLSKIVAGNLQQESLRLPGSPQGLLQRDIGRGMVDVELMKELEKKPYEPYTDIAKLTTDYQRGLVPEEAYQREIYSKNISEFEKSKERELGKLEAADIDLYKNMESKLPRLFETVDELSLLGKKASYTLTQRGRDFSYKELTGKSTEGSIARKEYMAIVNNQILPLLKQTFGGSFTVEEGNSLRETLGDVNATPEEKDAVLRAFIRQKINDVQDIRSKLGLEPLSEDLLNSFYSQTTQTNGSPMTMIPGQNQTNDYNNNDILGLR